MPLRGGARSLERAAVPWNIRALPGASTAACPASMSEPLPARLSSDGRTATWNPALTRAGQVLLRVRRVDGSVEERRSVNSGRARVREGEAIEAVVPAGEQ